MDTLVELMKKVLADTFTMYLKTHNYHWNVEGVNFQEYHAFFGSLYEELHGAVDPIAEHIRTLNVYSPGSLTRFSELTEIEDALDVPEASTMVANLLRDNQTILDTLVMTARVADKMNQIGLANFLQDRVDIHQKHAWMMRSMIK